MAQDNSVPREDVKNGIRPSRVGLWLGIVAIVVAMAGLVLYFWFQTLPANTRDGILFGAAFIVTSGLIASAGLCYELFRRSFDSLRETTSGILLATKTQTIQEIRQNLFLYAKYMTSVPLVEEVHQLLLQMMISQRQLNLSGVTELNEIGKTIAARQADELRMTGVSDIRIRMPRTYTYPIYEIIVNSSSYAHTLHAVNRIDLDWWLESGTPRQYIRDNHAALEQGKVVEIQRIFIVDRHKWDHQAAEKLAIIRDRILPTAQIRKKINLRAIFDDHINDQELRVLDIVVRSPALAVQWIHANDDGSYPELRVLTSENEVKRLTASAEAVFTNPLAKPIDEFLRDSAQIAP